MIELACEGPPNREELASMAGPYLAWRGICRRFTQPAVIDRRGPLSVGHLPRPSLIITRITRMRKSEACAGATFSAQ